MKLVTPTAPTAAPATPAPAEATVRRSPSTLSVPSLDNGSASAAASLDQVASYVGMLHAALGDDPAFYARLVKRGFLDNAIDYARYADSLIDYDKDLDNDGFKGMIEGAVLEAEATALGALAGKNLRDARQEFEKEFILRTLKDHDWNVSKTAATLGIERSHLHRKIKSYGIEE